MIPDAIQPVQYCIAAGVTLLAYYLVPYQLDPYDYRRRFPGPRLAAFTNWWMSNAINTGHHSETIRNLHEKYGTFVRIGPNHISIADPDAHEAVYGHGRGLLKSDFYHAFDGGPRDIFNTRDPVDHARRRKRVANIFSSQNVVAFEPRVSEHIRKLCEQLDMRCNEALRGVSGFNWVATNGRAVIDCCSQFGYLSFDIISDLAVGSPFGMIQLQRDAMSVNRSDKSIETERKGKEVTVIRNVASASKMLATIGVYPPWTHYFLMFLPWKIPGFIDLMALVSVTIAEVDKRLKRGSNRLEESMEGIDFLDKLMEVRNDNDSALPHQELIAEAMVMISAGGETTASSLGALGYYLATHPAEQRRLQIELDQHIPDETGYEKEVLPHSSPVVEYNQVKNLPYLNACIKETLRLHSTVATGLPRVVPPGKAFTFGGEIFKPGSVISVPSFTTNRMSVWGPDPAEFRPARWLEEDPATLHKYFVPFSTGTRSCVGRNLAMMNMILTAGTLFRRYNFEALPKTKLDTNEGFVRGVVSCEVAIKRRRVTNP